MQNNEPNYSISRDAVLALLETPQFGEIRDPTYRMNDEAILRLIEQCDSLSETIALASNLRHLSMAMAATDATILKSLPSPELKKILTVTVNRDPSLILGMPIAQSILKKVSSGISMSGYLDPAVLDRLEADLVAQKKATLRGLV